MSSVIFDILIAILALFSRLTYPQGHQPCQERGEKRTDRMTRAQPYTYEQKPSAEDRGGKFDDLIASFHSARSEIATLFALAGLDPTKTRESARELGLNRGLTWRLTRVVRESNPTLVVSDVPGSQSMAKFFDACRGRGAPEPAIATAMAALERFEAALSSCSGDRKTLAMLMANREDAESAVEREKARRSLFEGACGVWGVQAQTRFVSVFVFPCPENPEWLDVGHVNGFVGFRRLRPGAIALSHEAVHKASGEATTFIKEPLDGQDPANVPLRLMRDFCNPPSLDIRIVPSGDYNRFELAPGPVGNEGLSTCVFGTRMRRLYPRYSAEPDTAGFLVLLTTPVERVVFDMYLHKDLGINSPPPAQLLDRLNFPHQHIESEFVRQALPIAETPELLPPGIPGVMCPHIPWYPRMVLDVTSRIGHKIDDFVGSRFEMTYPPISTTLSRRFAILPGPER